MKLTNTTNLPSPLMDVAMEAITEHPAPEENVFFATELLKSPQQIALSRLHYNVLSMDVQDTFSLWLGTLIHTKLQQTAMNNPRYIAEERIVEELEDGIYISGEFDLLEKTDDGEFVLWDYKSCKSASADKAELGSDQHWLKQLYIYAWLIEKKYGKRPIIGKICAMITDHSMIKANLTSGYRKHPISVITFRLDDEEFWSQLKYELLEKAKLVNSIIKGEVKAPMCLPDDTFAKEDYAVKVKNRKTAVKCFDNSADALEFSSKYGMGAYVVHRVKEPYNCKIYCQCREFCKQAKSCNEDGFEEVIGLPF